METSDLKAIAVGLALLALGFFAGRRSKQNEDVEVESIRSEMREARREAENMRARLDATEEESANSGRALRALLDLLPGPVRNHVLRDWSARDRHDGGNGS